MAKHSGQAMHVARVRSVHGGREYVSVLLRQSYREGDKVKHRTLASLTALPPAAVDALERALRGETLVPASGGGLRIIRSLPHGHVAAALGMLRALGLERTLDRRSSRMRDLAVALIVARILAPASKLATARGLAATTLAAELDVEGATRGRAVWRARLAAGAPAGRSSGRSRGATSCPAAWSCSMSPPPGSRAAAARWRPTATAATTGPTGPRWCSAC